MGKREFFVLGQDRRYELLAAELSQYGTVFRDGDAGEEKGEAEKIYIFPMLAQDEDVFRALSGEGKRKAIFGAATQGQKEFCRNKKIPFLALLEEEVYLAQNALATAEGTLSEAIRLSEENLASQTVLIVGFGHCGSQIARLFALCGCEVFVFSRERGMKKALREGFSLFLPESGRLGMFDLVINTAPGDIFSEEMIPSFSPNALFLQVASGKAGFEAEKFCTLHRRYTALPGLPGRFSPKSEAEAIERLILKFIEESE